MVLSIVADGGKHTVVANPIFVTSRSAAEIRFEVLEKDAETLSKLVGIDQYFFLDGDTFWGKLRTLEPCDSTHAALAMLRDKRTLRAVMSVIKEDSKGQRRLM
jgi:hypothetical protein